jgi:hypothetical protein
MSIDAPFRIAFDNSRDPYAARNALQVQPGVNVVPLDTSGNAAIPGYIEGAGIADPAAPAANSGRLYFRDNGAGKTQLVVKFPTGAVQVIATEP